VFILFLVAGLAPTSAAAADWSAVAAAIGREGSLIGDVYKVSFSRSDLRVSVGGTPIKTGLALGGWAAFARDGDATVVDGDLVLLPGEINRVVSALQAHGLEVTALHNHLVDETPQVMYLHFFGQADGVVLARGLHAAIAETATPMAVPAPPPPETDRPAWARDVEQSFGHEGTLRGGVLSVAVPRPEPIHAHGATLAPSMGMAHAFNFQEIDGGRVAATGDFVLTDDEVNPVLRELRAGRVEVTAIHNHLLHGAPSLIFMHFWATGEPGQVGAALGRALARARTRPG
jgi:hypothetical protein